MSTEVYDVATEIEVIKKRVIKLVTLNSGLSNAAEIFDTIAIINSSLYAIYEYVVDLDNDKMRAEKIASELRKKCGEQFPKECDEAGIK